MATRKKKPVSQEFNTVDVEASAETVQQEGLTVSDKL